MSVDPYTDVAQWLDLDPRTEAIMRHPAGKSLMSREVQDHHDDEACRVGSVNWRVNEAHHYLSTGPRRRVLEVLLPSLTLIAVVAILFVDVFILNVPAVTA